MKQSAANHTQYSVEDTTMVKYLKLPLYSVQKIFTYMCFKKNSNVSKRSKLFHCLEIYAKSVRITEFHQSASTVGYSIEISLISLIKSLISSFERCFIIIIV